MLQPRKKDGVNGTGNGMPSGLTSGSDNAAGKGNPNGYASATSPLPNKTNKGGYEKTIDSSKDYLILRGGDKNEISRARKGSKEADEMQRTFRNKKADVESRRQTNSDFLETREKIGKKVK